MVKLNYAAHVTVFYKEDIIILVHISLIIPLQRNIYLKTDSAFS